jgi:hypothetical protein
MDWEMTATEYTSDRNGGRKPSQFGDRWGVDSPGSGMERRININLRDGGG